ncbi:MAG: flagellar hook-basal body protein [Candidatus Kapabacteria bacterium]|jgi:flagellar basal-body rod protein FlgF|nr:flagellar hook-basal body protein [Candidatus Kapabacteria bacterium]
MIKELYTAAMGMIPQQTRLEVIANNMANSNTSGFKRDNVFERNIIDAKANLWNTPGDAENDDPPMGKYIDFRNGSFQETGNSLDLVVQDNGFFNLQDEEGKEFLSRNGHFKLSTDGKIIAKDGKMLMGIDGPISVGQQFNSENTKEDNKVMDIKINDQGEVFANSQHVGSLLISKVENPQQMEKVSGECFVARENAGVTYSSNENVSVKQGWLEGSNVDIIKEMVDMIELQRMFEAGSKVIHTNDSTLDNSIKLGKYY